MGKKKQSVSNTSNTTRLLQRLEAVRSLLEEPGSMRVRKKMVRKTVEECRLSAAKRGEGKRDLTPLVVSSLATQVVLRALEKVPFADVMRVGTTAVIDVDGVVLRVHAVCGNSRYVLVNPRNNVRVNGIVGVRVEFSRNGEDFKVKRFELAGVLPWESVAVEEYFHEAGSPIVLPKCEAHPRGGSYRLKRACYAVPIERFAAHVA